MEGLFRENALKHSTNRLEGEVCVLPRISHVVITALLLIWLISVALFFFARPHTQTLILTGEILQTDLLTNSELQNNLSHSHSTDAQKKSNRHTTVLNASIKLDTSSKHINRLKPAQLVEITLASHERNTFYGYISQVSPDEGYMLVHLNEDIEHVNDIQSPHGRVRVHVELVSKPLIDWILDPVFGERSG